MAYFFFELALEGIVPETITLNHRVADCGQCTVLVDTTVL